MLAALAADPQVAAAARVAEETVRSSGLSGTLLALLAYSDGSVIAGGVEGSAAAVVRIGDKDASATARLAAQIERCRRGARSGRGCLWCYTSCGVSELMSHCDLATCRW